MFVGLSANLLYLLDFSALSVTSSQRASLKVSTAHTSPVPHRPVADEDEEVYVFSVDLRNQTQGPYVAF
jgi:hypothetical protein